MKAVNSHLLALKLSFETLAKGKLLIYFLPAAIAAVIYLYFTRYTSFISGAADSASDIWLVGGIVSGALEGISWFFDFLLLEIFKFVVLVILSPFNCLLSEKYDNELTGQKFDGGFVRMMNDLLRAMIIVLTAIIFELVTIAIYWVISWIIPDFIDSIVYFLISSFFFGFAFYDYSLERYGEGTFASWGFSFRHMSKVLLTGAIFTLVFKIPIAGIVIAPLLTTMIATVVYLQTRGLIKTPASNSN